VSAASVIAAGSVISEPSSGTSASPSQISLTSARLPGRDPGQHRLHEFEHRARGGHHHDHEHEQRLGVLARLHVLDRGGRAADQRHRDHQQHGPETEHHLHFAQQVEQAGVPRMAPGQALEQLGGEGVRQRGGEQAGGDHLDRLDLHLC
jgi:hypothetical protein